MMLTLALIAPVLLLALLVLVAVFGGTVARHLQDRRYKKLQELSDREALRINARIHERVAAIRAAKVGQDLRSQRNRAELYQWQREFAAVKNDVYFN